MEESNGPVQIKKLKNRLVFDEPSENQQLQNRTIVTFRSYIVHQLIHIFRQTLFVQFQLVSIFRQLNIVRVELGETVATLESAQCRRHRWVDLTELLFGQSCEQAQGREINKKQANFHDVARPIREIGQ